jgi:opacity protein-like surface antigen
MRGPSIHAGSTAWRALGRWVPLPVRLHSNGPSGGGRRKINRAMVSLYGCPTRGRLVKIRGPDPQSCRITRRSAVRAVLLSIALIAPATALRAQEQGTAVWVVAGPTLLVGEADDFLDGGWGGAAGLAVPLTSWLAIRGEFRFLGLSVDRDPGGEANNTVFAATSGLETEFGHWWLRPWASLSVGLFANRSRITVSGRHEGRTTWAAGTSIGGGLRAGLSEHLAASAGVDVSRAGKLDYGRYGGATPDFGHVRTSAAFLSVQLGLRWRLSGSSR